MRPGKRVFVKKKDFNLLHLTGKSVILQPDLLRYSCPGGGIGRRSRLKICRSQGCAGSIPVPGTSGERETERERSNTLSLSLFSFSFFFPFIPAIFPISSLGHFDILIFQN